MMKYYSALYLEERPPVALPPEAKAIIFQPHITLSVFESDDEIKGFDLETEIEINLSTFALHGRSTNQIMAVCPVVMNESFRAVCRLVPPDMRGDIFYHVTCGAMPRLALLEALYPNLTLINKSDLTTVVKSTRLVIEPFNPVSY